MPRLAWQPRYRPGCWRKIWPSTLTWSSLVLPVGSLDGLIALRQGLAHLTGCHLLDIDSGEYNLPYVRHLFPERSMKLVTLAHREQGLMLAAGNPRQIHGIDDLRRGEVSFINRNPGSGTRLWLTSN
jgi:putative molybdopterin biosynthesis protein